MFLDLILTIDFVFFVHEHVPYYLQSPPINLSIYVVTKQAA